MSQIAGMRERVRRRTSTDVLDSFLYMFYIRFCVVLPRERIPGLGLGCMYILGGISVDWQRGFGGCTGSD